MPNDMSFPRLFLPTVICLVAGLWLVRAFSPESALITLNVEADLYVSPAGRDSWSGRLPEPSADEQDGPLASIDEARSRVALIRRIDANRSRPIVVAIRGGIYDLKRPLVLGPDDSGTAKSPTIFRAFRAEKPMISGGMRLSKGIVGPGGVWSYAFSGEFLPVDLLTELFINGQRRYRPRLPERGFFLVQGGLEKDALGFSPLELDLKDVQSTGLEAVLLHDWSASRIRVKQINGEAIQLVAEPWQKPRIGDRFYLDNVGPTWARSGQFYVDRANQLLRYLPRPGEDVYSSAVVISRLERLLVLKGDLKRHRWVHDLVFEGLAFEFAAYRLPLEGNSMPQGEIGVGAAIDVVGARRIVFDRITVEHVGGYGIAFGEGCEDDSVLHSVLTDLGAGGIKIGHAGSATWDEVKESPRDPELAVSGISVSDSIIRHGGRIHVGGIGVWIGNSGRNSILRNEVSDFYQTGISVGWTWGYAQNYAAQNDIGFNYIHDIGQGVTSDLGGIYTLGVQRGTVIHDNLVVDVKCFSYGGWGLYADEGSSYIIFEHNIVIRAQSAGFFQHYGRENIVRENIFVDGGLAQIEGAAPEDWTSFYFYRNIVYSTDATPILAGCIQADLPCNVKLAMDENIYWNAQNKTDVFPRNRTLGDWFAVSKLDKHSSFADPGMLKTDSSGFVFLPNLVASQMGWVPVRILFSEPNRGQRGFPIVPPAQSRTDASVDP